MSGITIEAWIILPIFGVLLFWFLWENSKPWKCPICKLTEWEAGSYREMFKLNVPPWFTQIHRTCSEKPEISRLIDRGESNADTR